jgi:hypothetical protein
MAGARHMRAWMNAPRCHGQLHCALTGYAGGGRLIRYCAEGGDGRGCEAPGVFLARARWIESERAKRSGVM